MAADYSLGMTFASRRRQFLARVDIEVKNLLGKVVYAGTAQGPIVLVDLPDGRYLVQATYVGRTLSQTVAVSDRKSRGVTLNWPIEESSFLASDRNEGARTSTEIVGSDAAQLGMLPTQHPAALDDCGGKLLDKSA